jgi:MarR-like DNA-binding transcriptional regulator SgrR of sgrS sRNA
LICNYKRERREIKLKLNNPISLTFKNSSKGKLKINSIIRSSKTLKTPKISQNKTKRSRKEKKDKKTKLFYKLKKSFLSRTEILTRLMNLIGIKFKTKKIQSYKNLKQT